MDVLTGMLLRADTNARRLTYRLVAYGEQGATSLGRVVIDAGALTLPAASYLIGNLEHDRTRPVARAVELVDSPDQLVATFQVADSTPGTDLLAEAAAGLRTGVSVEVADPRIIGGHLTAGTLTGVGFVTAPAFPSSQLVASLTPVPDTEGPPVMPEPTPGDPPQTPVPAAATPDPAPTPPTPPAPQTWPQAAPVMHATAEPRPAVDLERFYGLMRAQAQGTATPEMLAALSDITHTANSGVTPNAWADELWSHLVYERQVVPTVSSASLTSWTVTGWRWVVRPAVAAWSGDKTAVPSNAPTTAPVTVSASRLAGAHDIDRKFRDFNDDSFFASYYAAMTESYAQLSDAALIADIKAAATAVTPTAGQVVANITALYNSIRAYGRATILIGYGVWDALAAITQSAAPGGVVPIPWLDMLVPTPLLGAAEAVAYPRQAVTFYELAGSPIRAEAIDMVKGGIDPGVFGYYATLVNQPAALAKMTTATVLEGDTSAYDAYPLYEMPATEQPPVEAKPVSGK